jgi:hypothetical protein
MHAALHSPSASETFFGAFRRKAGRGAMLEEANLELYRNWRPWLPWEKLRATR